MNRKHILLFLLLLVLLMFSSLAQDNKLQPQKRKYSFTENCADAHDREFISCVATSVHCNINLDELLPPPANDLKAVYPSEAHDIRIETFAKALSAKSDGDGQSHQLIVDITWQTPPNNSTRALKAFLLEIESERERKNICFLLNVSGTDWTPEKVAQSPRLHFASNSLFAFSQSYEIELYSLPEKNAGAGASVHTRFTTPQNPSGNSSVSAGFLLANCSKQSNQFASKWTAGFRHIYVHSAARVMQVEFIGAPLQYCFESYEVRLLDETGLELLYSGTVLAEDMQLNGSMVIGKYNFTNLEYDRMYIPSVIPVERAADGRCLCPVFGIDPYDVKVVCSCVAADWKPVRMTRPDVVKICSDCSANHSLGLLPPSKYTNSTTHNKISIMWPLFVLFNAFFLLLLCIFVIGYLRLRSNGSLPSKVQFQTVRFVPPRKGRANERKDNEGRTPPPYCISSSTTSSLAVRSNFGLGTVSTVSLTASTPLISTEDNFDALICDACPPQNILIVYSHDSEAHQRAVLALAEFLRDLFNLKITLDQWNLERIEQNLVDWLSASVVEADKVLVVNSAGTWERYRTKTLSRGSQIVEKIRSDPLDSIFIAHIDMALQHHSLISARFNYTEPEQTLPMLKGRLQYLLPDNICALVSAIFGKNMRNDERFSPLNIASCPSMTKLRESIDEMSGFCSQKPNWFTNTHQFRLNSFGMMRTTEITANATEFEETCDKDDENAPHEMELMPLHYLGQQNSTSNNSGKMDSGIFEWGGGDGETDGTTNADLGQNYEAVSNSVVYRDNETPAEEREEREVDERRLNCATKTVTDFTSRAVKNAEMDSGLVADMSPATEKTVTFAAAAAI